MKKINKFYILSFVMNIFLNLAHPITPTLIKNMNIGSYLFGIAYACMALGQFFSSAIWGKFAKKSGDITAVLYGLAIYAIGQYMFYKSTNGVTVGVARIIGGIGTGGFMVAMISYLAKIADDKSKCLTLYTAISVFSSTIGYLLGGIIGDYSIGFVFAVQVIGILFVMLSFKVLLKNIYFFEEIENKVYFSNRTFEKKYIVLNLLVVFCLTATTCYDQSFNYYIKDILNFKPSGNGMIKAILGITAFFTSIIFSKVQRNQHQKCYLNFIFLVCGLILLFMTRISNISIFLMMNTIFFVLNSLYLPMLQNIYLQSENMNEYSVLSGNFNIFKSIGLILGALVAGFSYELNSIMPFILSSMLFLCNLGLIYLIYQNNETKRR